MQNETAIRMAVFDWLKDREPWNGGIFSGSELMQGIQVDGRRITLKGQTGIWFPQGFSVPLSITTSNKGPYKLDDIGDDGLVTYAYRGTDPDHRDNRGLREAMRTRTPLIYFKEVQNHKYQAIWPVIIIDDVTIVEKDQFTDPKTIFERGWATLLQRFENTMKAHNFPGPTNADECGMVIADNTSGEDLRNLQRKMRRYNPIPSKYGSYSRNIPVKLIIEDPVFRDSRHSYFVQMVDVIAYFTSQYLKPNKIVKKQGAAKYFERLDPVLVKKASPADSFGRVWIKK